MFKGLVWAVTSWTLLVSPLKAADHELLPKSVGTSTQLSYDLDAVLLYADALSGLTRPASLRADESAGLAEPDERPRTYRTLGLRHMKVGVEWLTPRRLRAFVLVRPDAVRGHTEVTRELDTRSGLRSIPTEEVQLLDLYELAVLRDGVTFAAGVRDRVMPEHKAYSDILGFGLEPRDPRKVFGLFLDLPALTKLGTDGKVSLRAAAIGDRNDRHTERNVSEESQDESPASRTPYWGGAVAADFSLSSETSVGGGVSLVESKTVTGKSTNSFYELGVVRSMSMSGQEIRVGMEVRQEKNSYKAETLTLAATSGTSASLTASAEVLPGRMALVGVKVATTTRQSMEDTSRTLPARGIQAETGFRAWLGDGMEASSLITREWCRGQMEGEAGQAGCFGVSGKRQSVISRFALQVAYRTGGSL